MKKLTLNETSGLLCACACVCVLVVDASLCVERVFLARKNSLSQFSAGFDAFLDLERNFPARQKYSELNPPALWNPAARFWRTSVTQNASFEKYMFFGLFHSCLVQLWSCFSKSNIRLFICMHKLCIKSAVALLDNEKRETERY